MYLLISFFTVLGLGTAASAELHGGWRVANYTKGSVFEQNVNYVLKYISEQTPLRNTSSIEYGNFPDVVYGFGQCIDPNMTQSDCGYCIDNALKWLLSAAPQARGGAANDTSRCFARYEDYFFPEASPGPSATPRSPPLPSRSKKVAAGVIVGSVGFGVIVVGGGALFIIWMMKRRPKTTPLSRLKGSLEGPIAYNYKELQEATGNFSQENKLGEGGFGSVYKAVTANGTVVAVKKLRIPPEGAGHRETQFVNEVSIIGSIQHRSLVKLKGYCIEGNDRMLVLEYFRNGSLYCALFEGRLDLDWPTRYRITVGVARGLAYLHEESQIRIIHRDIKSSNILLDDKLDAKISDFGLSKLFDPEKGMTSTTNVAGTYGYLAPEYAMRGQLTSKADVFSFGVVVFEIISGRKCNHGDELLIQEAWKLYETGTLESLVDARLQSSQIHAADASRALGIALLCTQQDEACRPSMSEVVAMLLGYLEIRLPSSPMQGPSAFCFAQTRRSEVSSKATTTSTSTSKSAPSSAKASFTTSFDGGNGR